MNLLIILYLVGLLRTIFFIVVVYFILKLFTRYVLPLILENKIRQMQRNRNGSNQKHNQPREREGDVTIDYGNQNSRNSQNKNDGEYVDFEEIE